MSGDGRGWEEKAFSRSGVERCHRKRDENSPPPLQPLLAVGKRRRKREALRGINFELLRKNNSRKKNLRCDDVLLSKEFFFARTKKNPPSHVSFASGQKANGSNSPRAILGIFFFQGQRGRQIVQRCPEGGKGNDFFCRGRCTLSFYFSLLFWALSLMPPREAPPPPLS